MSAVLKWEMGEYEPGNVGDRTPYRAAGMLMGAVVAAVPFGM